MQHRPPQPSASAEPAIIIDEGSKLVVNKLQKYCCARLKEARVPAVAHRGTMGLVASHLGALVGTRSRVQSQSRQKSQARGAQRETLRSSIISKVNKAFQNQSFCSRYFHFSHFNYILILMDFSKEIQGLHHNLDEPDDLLRSEQRRKVKMCFWTGTSLGARR